ncbi:MAG: ABC transporter ATP-binding protein [Candidatus Riflebacteria bacterium]|nr:ABC transporter ATP-binding protein [Candidatus Riflebacteria bacterium]MBR4570308.1 ABC transporter ATP-binding protein [Candidatus Riflebacteria bacterium]
MIELSHLTRKFNEHVAVDDLCLNIPNGAMFGFLGANGAGKTTTLKMIMGLLQPTAGSVAIDGLNVAANPVEVKSKVGYLPDEVFLYDYLTGRQFLDFVADIYNIKTEEREEKINNLLVSFGLEEAADDFAGNYSFGMKKKLALAGIVVHNPSLLILDEPFNGLDPQATRDFKNMLKKMSKEGTTIIFSSHVLEVVEKMVTHVGIINKGKLKICDSIENIVKNYKSLEKAFFAMT